MQKFRIPELPPIPQPPRHVAERLMGWKEVPILEEAPADLVVLPSLPEVGRVMGCPAYYKNPDVPMTVSGLGELAWTTSGRLARSPLVVVRRKVRLMLDRAQEILDRQTCGAIKLVAVDGFRPTSVQAALYNAYRDWLAKRNPDWTLEKLDEQAQFMVSQPQFDPKIVSVRPPHHATGAAVDVVLAWSRDVRPMNEGWLGKAVVDMGSIFDEMMHPVHADARSGLRYFEDCDSNPDARSARRLLYWAMTEAGFTSYPGEWFHYQVGNQLDAYTRGLSFACFGYCEAEYRSVVDWESTRRAGQYACMLINQHGLGEREAIMQAAVDFGIEHLIPEIPRPHYGGRGKLAA